MGKGGERNYQPELSGWGKTNFTRVKGWAKLVEVEDENGNRLPQRNVGAMGQVTRVRKKERVKLRRRGEKVVNSTNKKKAGF